MQRTRNLLSAAVLLVTAALCFTRCGNSERDVNPSATDTSPMVSAPDNNSANNPSLADTAYEKNRTTPITDSMRRDTTHRRP